MNIPWGGKYTMAVQCGNNNNMLAMTIPYNKAREKIHAGIRGD